MPRRVNRRARTPGLAGEKDFSDKVMNRHTQRKEPTLTMSTQSNITTKPNVVVVGSFMMDLIVRTERMPKEGETIVGKEFQRAPGGKGANQAMAAARLGGRVTMVGRVGDDLFGQDQIRSLREAGIETSYITIDPEAPTGVGSITLDDSSGNNRIIIVPGANMRCVPEDVDRAQAALEAADVILLQCEIPAEVNLHVLRRAKELGKPVIFNPAPARPLDRETLELVTVLTPNETEAEALTGVEIRTIEDAEQAAVRLREQGVQTVIITLGAKGSLLYDASGPKLAPTWPVEVVDPTAAGDAFNGAFAVAFAKGLPVEEALRFANAAGALTVTAMGAQPSIPTLEKLEAFVREREGAM